ncbi:MAG TPA: pitrilysin family protein [Cyclobacteriaceae bacterium]|nr:pitrilysin family protein [Cyclobacteriaceae bacterium]
MISFDSFELPNGLKVFVHEDPSVQIAVMNILYDVGSRDENSQKTGFAHLFEHLMFGGSKHIPSYDEPLQKVGGENNAFTNTDITNYYLTVPADNLETGFWLESDRMLSLSFDPRVLEVQRKVVIEEFKQRYLNQPYGDVWLKLRPLVYKVHPYQWATIGKEIRHIEEATMEDVKNFFYSHYLPNNAIMVVAGNVKKDQVMALSEKWFGPIPAGAKMKRALPLEPAQNDKRILEVESDVPAEALYKAYHMPGRFHEDFHAADLLSDVLGRGDSSRLYRTLVKEKNIFNSISAFTMGSIDPGLIVINGRVREGIDLREAEKYLDEVVNTLSSEGISDIELEKVKNQAISTLEFGEVEVLNRAMNLAFSALSGDADLVNKEMELVGGVSKQDVERLGKELLRDANSSVMYYRSKKK